MRRKCVKTSRAWRRARWAVVWAMLLVALYRAVVVTPIGGDGYLLYLPEVAFLFPYLLLLLACLRSGRGRLVCLILGTLITFTWLIPLRASSSSSSGGDVLLLSANLQSWGVDIDQAAERMARESPDLLCLQEVWSAKHLEAIAEWFPEFEFWAGAGDSPFEHGVFVATPKAMPASPLFSSPGLAAVLLELKQGPVLLVSVHGRKGRRFGPEALLETVEMQKEQAQEIVRLWTEAGCPPCIIAGDFNAPLSAPGPKLLRREFEVAFLEAGERLGATFPSSFPLIGIDHIFGSERITFFNYRLKDVGSDHLAQLVKWRLEPPAYNK